MKTLIIKGQNIKAEVLVGGSDILISEARNTRNYEATAEVNGYVLHGVQHISNFNGRLSVTYTFDGIKFNDSHKKIAEYIYIKYLS